MDGFEAGETTFFIMGDDGECKTWKQPAEKPISQQNRVWYDIGKYNISDETKFNVDVYGVGTESFDVSVVHTKTDSGVLSRTLTFDGCADYIITTVNGVTDPAELIVNISGHSITNCYLRIKYWQIDIPEHIKTLTIKQHWVVGEEPINQPKLPTSVRRERQNTLYGDKE